MTKIEQKKAKSEQRIAAFRALRTQEQLFKDLTKLSVSEKTLIKAFQVLGELVLAVDKLSQETPQEKREKETASLKAQIGSTLAALMFLTSCVPESGIIEAKPIITLTAEKPTDTNEQDPTEETTIGLASPEASPTVIASPTVENTPTKTATAKPEKTATPEKTEEEKMNEYCIKRAKEVGIDLENFANSNNLWVTEHQGLAGLEEAFNTSFTDDRTFKTMIVVGIDSLNSQSRYDKAPTTAEGKKIMGWLEVVYKKANGNYQLVLLPTHIWDIESERMWDKSPDFGGPRFATEINSKARFKHIISNYSIPGVNYNPDLKFATSFFTNYISQGVWMGPGAFLNVDSDYPSLTAGGAGTIEAPNFTAEEHALFQQAGEAGFLPYYIIDPDTGLKLFYLYPFVNSASSSRTDHYTNQDFIAEIVAWRIGDNKQWLNPAGQPCPRHWQAKP